MSERMRVLTILVRYGTEHYPHAERQIAAIFERQMPGIERTVVVVDNALPAGFVEKSEPRRTLISGDNSAREFSGLDRGIAYVGADIWRYDLVHLATEAFNSLYVAYLDRFDTSLLEAVATRPVCVGHIDYYNEPVEILGFHTQHWLRSCFVFLPPAEIAILGSLVTVRDRGRFFSDIPDAPFLPSAPLSLKYREYITAWLTGGDIGQGVVWHSSFALAQHNLPTFEAKAMAIMNEQMFGVRLRAMGCRVIDVTWLARTLSKGRVGTDCWQTGWRQQLAGRDAEA